MLEWVETEAIRIEESTRERHVEKAKEYLRAAREKNPDDPQAYINFYKGYLVRQVNRKYQVVREAEEAEQERRRRAYLQGGWVGKLSNLYNTEAT